MNKILNLKNNYEYISCIKCLKIKPIFYKAMCKECIPFVIIDKKFNCEWCNNKERHKHKIVWG